MTLSVRPLTPDLWPDLEALFGKAGASNGCWCMFWRIGPAYHKRPREKNKAALRTIVRCGPPSGLIAFDGDAPVGWCLLAPRATLPWLERSMRLDTVDDDSTWSMPCFFIRAAYRRRGVTTVLIEAALRTARRAGASALESYPIDTHAPKSTGNIFTGVASTFRRSGFKTVARHRLGRVIMRHDLKRRSV